jgi:hypothetical protein
MLWDLLCGYVRARALACLWRFVRIHQTVNESHILGGRSCAQWLKQTWTPGFVESSCEAVYFRTLSFLVTVHINSFQKKKYF